MNLQKEDPLDLTFKKRDQFLVVLYLFISISVFFAYTHLMNWGPHSCKIIFLKARQIAGKMSSDDYVKMAEICAARGKEKCVRQTYNEMYRKTNDIESFALLAKFEVRNHDIQLAAKDFDTYYRNGGKNPQVALQYALVLEQMHDYNNAIQFLKLSTRQNHEKLLVYENSEIVRLLILQQKYHQAESHIDSFWSKSKVAKAYLINESNQIKKIIGDQGERGVASR